MSTQKTILTFEITSKNEISRLDNQTMSLIFGASKITNSIAPYYLKQIKPTEKHITGLFPIKARLGYYQGRTIDKRKLVLCLNGANATITIFWF